MDGEEKGGTAMVYKGDCKAEENCQWGGEGAG